MVVVEVSNMIRDSFCLADQSEDALRMQYIFADPRIEETMLLVPRVTLLLYDATLR